ncbi:MAG: hypothetical protein GXO15_05200 [Crenarchaeota archaeon]|nr:hypothetical protein [Thermoproteota archaeon]
MRRLGYTCRPAPRYRLRADGGSVEVCEGVYEPAEDSWLAYSVVEKLLLGHGFELCIDLGTGTGLLTLPCSLRGVYTLAVDLNPCAVACVARAEPRPWDAAQCDSVSCIRCPIRRRTLLVYNTPYLPVEDEGLEGLAWSGGLSEALRAARWAASCMSKGCIVLVYSSLSGDDTGLRRLLEGAGYRLELLSRRFFFEELRVLYGCRMG